MLLYRRRYELHLRNRIRSQFCRNDHLLVHRHMSTEHGQNRIEDTFSEVDMEDHKK